MERAKVYIIEDSETSRKVLQAILERCGHQIVGTATTLTQALAAVDRFAELGVQVAILDSNLSPTSCFGQDGKIVYGAIRQKAPSVRVILYTGDFVDYDEQVKSNGDLVLIKPVPIREMLNAITKF